MNSRTGKPKPYKPLPSPQKPGWLGRAALAVLCMLTIWIYAAIAYDTPREFGTGDASKDYYNLLVDGFRSGQLSLKQSVPSGLMQLADPYDPKANGPYRGNLYQYGRLHDLSYYHGRLYLYFGITPALVLFWPLVAVTGYYIDHATAVVIFGTLGFIVSIGLLYALWRRYFSQISIIVVMALALALGLVNSLLSLMARPDIWEVPVSCGYAMVMLTLAALWGAWHQPLRRGLWLAFASLAYGLAIGARPSLLFGAVILLGPVVQTWSSIPAGAQRWRETVRMAVAAMGPICAVGCGLLIYNYLRFDNPFEFGQSYQLAGDRQDNVRHFSLEYLWINWRMYFLSRAEWSRHFPFLNFIMLQDGNNQRIAYGVLTNSPFVWLALAVPLAWRRGSLEPRSGLRWFVASVAVLFGFSALFMGLFYGTCLRYQAEFVPALVWLAVVGWLAMELWLVKWPRWRVVFRCFGGALLAYSVAFSLLYGGYVLRANQWDFYARFLLVSGDSRQAINQFKKVMHLRSGYGGAHIRLVIALCREREMAAAQAQFEQALRFADPGEVASYYGFYGRELIRNGYGYDGIAVLRAGLERVPDSSELHQTMGEALVVQGRGRESLPYFEKALRLQPKSAGLHCSLGILLAQEGKLDEAIGHWQQALQLNPKMIDAHYNLGMALLNQGLQQEAILHFKEVLRIDPNNEPVRERLRLLAGFGVPVQ